MVVFDIVAHYRQARQAYYARLDVVRQAIDSWLERHQDQEPDLTAIALLEGLQHERARLLAEFNDLESRFIESLLSHRRAVEA